MNLIVAILFLILCPCISYIIVRRKIVPWTGGVYLVMADDKQIPVNFRQFDTEFPFDAVIKGIYLSGARADMMPEVSLRRFLRNKNRQITSQMISHYLYEDDGGVYQFFCRPMKGSEFSFFLVDVYAPYPWRGYKSKGKHDQYYGHVQFNFLDRPKTAEPDEEAMEVPFSPRWN